MEATEYAKREFEARNKAIADFRAIIDAAGDEKRDLTPEEDAQIAKFEAEVAQRDARVQQFNRMAQAAAVVEENRAIVGAAAGQAENTSQDVQFAEHIRSFWNADGEPDPNVRPESFTTALARVPFTHFGGGTTGSQALQSIEKRVLSDTGASGIGVSFNSEFSTNVSLYMRTLSPILGLATVINSSNGAPLILPRITADPTVYTPGEGTAITASDPTLSAKTLTLTAYKALTLVNQELAEDEVIQLMTYIARTQGRALGLAANTQFTTGTNGYIADGTNGGTAVGTPFFDYDDLLGLEYSAPAPYRLGAQWVMANSAILKARKFKGSDGQYLWQQSAQFGQPDTLSGHPVYEDPTIATVASASKSVAFGDFSAYFIKQLPLRFATSTDYLFNTDQIAIKSVWRVGGALADVLAIRYLVSGNT